MFSGKLVTFGFTPDTSYKEKSRIYNEVTAQGGTVKKLFSKQCDLLLTNVPAERHKDYCNLREARKHGVPVRQTSELKPADSQQQEGGKQGSGKPAARTDKNECIDTEFVEKSRSEVLKYRLYKNKNDYTSSLELVVFYQKEGKPVFMLRKPSHNKADGTLFFLSGPQADSAYEQARQECDLRLIQGVPENPNKVTCSPQLYNVLSSQLVSAPDHALQSLLYVIWTEAVGALQDILACQLSDVTMDNVIQAQVRLSQLKAALSQRDESRTLVDGVEFYTLIPHKQEHKVPLKTTKQVTQKQELCQLLHGLLRVTEASGYRPPQSSQARLSALGCSLHSLSPDGQEHRALCDQLSKHGGLGVSVLNIFTVNRPEETENFRADLGNVTRLYHGTQPDHLVGILSGGLVLPLAAEKDRGVSRSDIGLLGAGIYFTDSVRFGLRFARPSRLTHTHYLLVADVALGSVATLPQPDISMTTAPPGHHSAHLRPRPGARDGVWAVYRADQLRLRYLVELGNPAHAQRRAEVNEVLPDPLPVRPVELVDTEGPEETRCGLLAPGGVCVPLRAVKVTAGLQDLAAKVTVIQEYLNDQPSNIETKYVFPLSEKAAVVGFEAYINNKRVVGVVKEKQRAHREYSRAVQRGHGAYLMDRDTEQPNVFTMSVGNLPPGARVFIKITYVCELLLDQGALVFSLPGHVAGGQARVAQTQAVTRTVNVGAVVPGFELLVEVRMPFNITNLRSPTHRILAKRTDTQALVKLADKAPLGDGFRLRVSLQDSLTPRMWVEQLPGDPENQACMLVFHPRFAAPATPHTEVVLLLDRSRSMCDAAGDSACTAAMLCLQHLRDCSFNVYTFATDYSGLFSSSQPATEENLRAAADFIKTPRPAQGNTCPEVLLRHLGLLRSREQQVVLISDGHLTHLQGALRVAQSDQAARSRVFCIGVGPSCNSHALQTLARMGGGAFTQLPDSERPSWPGRCADVISRTRVREGRDVSVRWRFHDDEPGPVQQAPAVLPSVFSGEKVVVYGLIPHCRQAELEFTVDGVRESTVVSVPDLCVTTGETLHQLAARALLEDWEQGVLSEDHVLNEVEKKKRRADIVNLSTRYGVLSSLTSFVAVEERDKNFRVTNRITLEDIFTQQSIVDLTYIDWREVTNKAEVKAEQEVQYEKEYREAKKNYGSNDIRRLKIALKYSEYLMTASKDKTTAVKVAKEAFDDAVSELDCLNEESYKDSTLTLQQLRDNLTCWTNEEGKVEKAAVSQPTSALQNRPSSRSAEDSGPVDLTGDDVTAGFGVAQAVMLPGRGRRARDRRMYRTSRPDTDYTDRGRDVTDNGVTFAGEGEPEREMHNVTPDTAGFGFGFSNVISSAPVPGPREVRRQAVNQRPHRDLRPAPVPAVPPQPVLMGQQQVEFGYQAMNFMVPSELLDQQQQYVEQQAPALQLLQPQVQLIPQALKPAPQAPVLLDPGLSFQASNMCVALDAELVQQAEASQELQDEVNEQQNELKEEEEEQKFDVPDLSLETRGALSAQHEELPGVTAERGMPAPTQQQMQGFSLEARGAMRTENDAGNTYHDLDGTDIEGNIPVPTPQQMQGFSLEARGPHRSADDYMPRALGVADEERSQRTEDMFAAPRGAARESRLPAASHRQRAGFSLEARTPRSQERARSQNVSSVDQGRPSHDTEDNEDESGFSALPGVMRESRMPTRTHRQMAGFSLEARAPPRSVREEGGSGTSAEGRMPARTQTQMAQFSLESREPFPTGENDGRFGHFASTAYRLGMPEPTEVQRQGFSLEARVPQSETSRERSPTQPTPLPALQPRVMRAEDAQFGFAFTNVCEDMLSHGLSLQRAGDTAYRETQRLASDTASDDSDSLATYSSGGAENDEEQQVQEKDELLDGDVVAEAGERGPALVTQASAGMSALYTPHALTLGDTQTGMSDRTSHNTAVDESITPGLGLGSNPASDEFYIGTALQSSNTATVPDSQLRSGLFASSQGRLDETPDTGSSFGTASGGLFGSPGTASSSQAGTSGLFGSGTAIFGSGTATTSRRLLGTADTSASSERVGGFSFSTAGGSDVTGGTPASLFQTATTSVSSHGLFGTATTAPGGLFAHTGTSASGGFGFGTAATSTSGLFGTAIDTSNGLLGVQPPSQGLFGTVTIEGPAPSTSGSVFGTASTVAAPPVPPSQPVFGERLRGGAEQPSNARVPVFGGRGFDSKPRDAGAVFGGTGGSFGGTGGSFGGTGGLFGGTGGSFGGTGGSFGGTGGSFGGTGGTFRGTGGTFGGTGGTFGGTGGTFGGTGGTFGGTGGTFGGTGGTFGGTGGTFGGTGGTFGGTGGTFGGTGGTFGGTGGTFGGTGGTFGGTGGTFGGTGGTFGGTGGTFGGTGGTFGGTGGTFGGTGGTFGGTGGTFGGTGGTFGGTGGTFGGTGGTFGGTGPAFGGTGPAFGITGPAFGGTVPEFGRTGAAVGETGPVFGAGFGSLRPAQPMSMRTAVDRLREIADQLEHTLSQPDDAPGPPVPRHTGDDRQEAGASDLVYRNIRRIGVSSLRELIEHLNLRGEGIQYVDLEAGAACELEWLCEQCGNKCQLVQRDTAVRVEELTAELVNTIFDAQNEEGFWTMKFVKTVMPKEVRRVEKDLRDAGLQSLGAHVTRAARRLLATMLILARLLLPLLQAALPLQLQRLADPDYVDTVVRAADPAVMATLTPHRLGVLQALRYCTVTMETHPLLCRQLELGTSWERYVAGVLGEGGSPLLV